MAGRGGVGPESAARPEAAAAWGPIFARYRVLAVRLARGVVLRTELAEDVVQDAARAVMERPLPDFDSEEHARNYFLRAVRHRALDVLRAGERTPEVRQDLAEASAPGGSDPRQSLEDEEDLLHRRERLQQALGRLDRDERELLRERYLEGRAYREIAQRTGAPISTLHSRIEAALGRLRRNFGKEEGRS